MEVGNRIREIRKRLGITQKVLAKKVGVSPLTIYRIEAGKLSPSVALLSEIAKFLNYPISSFLFHDDKSVIHIKGKSCQVIKSDNLELKVLSPRGVISENISISFGKAKKGEFVDTHKNVGFEIAYAIKGKCIFKQGNKEYEMEEGDLIFHDGSIPHSVKALEPHVFLGIHLMRL